MRHRVRLYNKLIDEYLHNSCMILTFATAFRPNFLKLPREAWLAEINKSPLKRRAEYKRSVIEHGLDSEFVSDAIAQHKKLLSWMSESLQSGPYLAGDGFSNADCAVIPYILRLELLKLRGMWDRYPADRRLVGADARAAVGQGRDFRSHDRGRLGAVPQSRARSVAESGKPCCRRREHCGARGRGFSPVQSAVVGLGLLHGIAGQCRPCARWWRPRSGRLLGYALARHLLPRVLAIGAAPVDRLGGLQRRDAAALHPDRIFFADRRRPSPRFVSSSAAVTLLTRRAPADATPAPNGVNTAMELCRRRVACAGAGRRDLPKFSADGVHLADPDFRSFQDRDHRRDDAPGLAAGQSGVRRSSARPGRLAYYYLWHFSAAELALPLRVSGWEADIGLTWFTAFASLTLMMGVAVWLSKRPGAAILVVVLAAAASLRATLSLLFGS